MRSERGLELLRHAGSTHSWVARVYGEFWNPINDGGERRKRPDGSHSRAVQAGRSRWTDSAKERQGKKHIEPVPESELEVVESGFKFKMRKEAARSCRALLQAARAALEEAQKAGDAAAKRTTAIGIASSYRDYEHDARAWSNAFNKHYEKEENRMEAMPGGCHGDAALQWFITLMSPSKAPPGFSNHSNGLAVDFSTTDAGVKLGPDTSQRAAWRRSWLHPWLVANALAHRFHPLASEEWHWDWA